MAGGVTLCDMAAAVTRHIWRRISGYGNNRVDMAPPCESTPANAANSCHRLYIPSPSPAQAHTSQDKPPQRRAQHSDDPMNLNSQDRSPPASQETAGGVRAVLVGKLRSFQTQLAAMTGFSSNVSRVRPDKSSDESSSRPKSSSQQDEESSQAADSAVVPQSQPAAGSESVREELLRHAQQHAAQMRHEHGIRVRDFAYESTLPPVPAMRRLPAPPRSRALKRKSRFYEDDDEPHIPSLSSPASSPNSYPNKRPRPLRREPTEPLTPEDASTSQARRLGRRSIEPLSQPSQQLSYGDLNDLFHNPPSQAQSDTNTPHRPLTPPRRLRLSLPNSPSNPLDIPVEDFASSRTPIRPSGWVDTPVVTPNGSCHFDFSSPVQAPSTLPTIPETGESQKSQISDTASLEAIPMIVDAPGPVEPAFSLSQPHPTLLPAPYLSPRPSLLSRHLSHASLRDISRSPSRTPLPSTSTSQSSPRYQLRSRTGKAGPSALTRAGSRNLFSKGCAAPSQHKQGRKTRSTLSKKASGKNLLSAPVRRSTRIPGGRAAKR